MGATGRAAGLAFFVTLLAGPIGAQPRPGPPDAELLAGIRQVQEGDFETALVTLDGVVRRLAVEPGRDRDLSQAHLYLGIATLALDQNDVSAEHFRDAVRRDPGLALSPDRFSPKVLAALEAARRQVEAAKPRAEGGSRTGLILLGVGGAGAAAVALASGGGDGGDTEGTVRFMNARFGTPVIECANDVFESPLPFSIFVDGANDGDRSMTIESVTTTIVIVNSSFPEVDQASSKPTTVVPTAVAARSRQTLVLSSYILCFNAAGDAPRFNEWRGRVTLVTSGGVFTLETADRMRINIP